MGEVTPGPPELCCHCGAVLSRYRDAGETLCAPCSHMAAERAPELRILGAEELTDAVAGVLLLARALTPGESVHLRGKLAAMGVDADHVDIRHAVRKLEVRHSMRIDADARQTGHRLDGWPHLGKLAAQYRRLMIDN